MIIYKISLLTILKLSHDCPLTPLDYVYATSAHFCPPLLVTASEYGIDKQFNPTKLFIDVCCMLGLASECKRATGESVCVCIYLCMYVLPIIIIIIIIILTLVIPNSTIPHHFFQAPGPNFA